MYGGAWQATVHGVARVGHDLATKPPRRHSTQFHLFGWEVVLSLKVTQSEVITLSF